MIYYHKSILSWQTGHFIDEIPIIMHEAIEAIDAGPLTTKVNNRKILEGFYFLRRPSWSGLGFFLWLLGCLGVVS